MTQLKLPLISREFGGEIIQQRAVDGYINATAMGKASGKKINDYGRLSTTKEFLVELSSETGIPVSELVITIKGGPPALQGTWVHPDVAIHLGHI
ncbi:MAG: KilA-N domain-containing protein [Nitrospiraceae bacterium]|nr:KilA-N domain-containing protein [Nitrospiraceae bacterium]